MPLGRLLIVLGLVLVVAGLLLTYTNIFSSLKLGRLPGDISIKHESFSFYFPVTTCVLVSLVLTLIVYLLRK